MKIVRCLEAATLGDEKCDSPAGGASQWAGRQLRFCRGHEPEKAQRMNLGKLRDCFGKTGVFSRQDHGGAIPRERVRDALRVFDCFSRLFEHGSPVGEVRRGLRKREQELQDGISEARRRLTQHEQRVRIET